MSAEELALLICEILQHRKSVEIDGLGTFARDHSGRIALSGGNKPRVFIAYAVEDAEAAEKLYTAFEARGYAPWLDRRKLLPGQNWPRRIQDAIDSAEYFVPCFSKRSVNKRGGFQVEVRHALECASRMPLDDVYLIPARLDNCTIPARIQRETQYVDLFPDWNAGFERIVSMIERQRRIAA